MAFGAVIGLTIARRIADDGMPQLVAAFHSWSAWPRCWWLGGLPQSRSLRHRQGRTGNILPVSRVEMGLGIGHRRDHLLRLGHRLRQAERQHERRADPAARPPCHQPWHAAAILGLTGLVLQDQGLWVFWTITALAFIIGFLLIIPIGGADMPVVVSMLNSYSGWAAAAMGFTLHNTAMIITGALVGSSGAILSYIMCKAMNRSFISVIAGGFGAEPGAGGAARGRPPVEARLGRGRGLHDEGSRKVIIIPGYGMAVAQAQHVAARDGRPAQEQGRHGQVRDPPGRGPHAGPHERAAGRSQRAL
jgi:NAD(P) transhydrogenase subunit beta